MDFMDDLLKALAERGLVMGKIRVDHSEYIFADGRWEIQQDSGDPSIEIDGPDQAFPRLVQERIADETKKTVLEPRKPADAFIDDYFPREKSRKTGKGLWIAAAIAIVAVSAFFIVQKTGRLEEKPTQAEKFVPTKPEVRPQIQEQQPDDVAAAKKIEAGRVEAEYKALFREAASFFAGNQLNSAWQKAELAEKIKPTAEIADLKKKIQKKQEAAAAAAKARADEEKRKKEEAAAKAETLKNYLDASEKFLQKGDFDRAFENVFKAKQIENSPEVAAMESRLKVILAEIEKQKQASRKIADKTRPAPETQVAKADEPKTVVAPEVLPGKISDLASDLATDFSSLVQRIIISDVTGSFSVSGFVTVTLRIDDKGRTRVQAMNENGLSAEPESFRERIRKAITLSLTDLRFPEPKNKVGNRITVENWRVNFKIGQFSGKIIINRQ